MGIRIGIGVDVFRVSGIDPSAAAFLTAAGITDPTIVNAINRLVLNYKGQGNLNSSVDLWSVSSAIYPMVGGTASTNKFNLKDSRDLDAAFRLSFSGGWTHSSNGILGNGTNSFANTFFNPSTQFSPNSGSIAVYIRNNVDEIRYDFGCTQTTNELMIIARGSNLQYANYGPNATYGTAANTDSRGWFETTRIGAINTYGRKNGVTTITHIETENRPNFNLYIGGNNNSGTAANFASKNYAFAKIGQALSDANSLLEYNIIQQFQTDLGRAV
jgi:hypothetical protein